MSMTERSTGPRLTRRGLAAVLALPVIGAGLWQLRAQATETAMLVPAPGVGADIEPGTGQETLVVAGGCFWGVQAVFQHVDGVAGAVSGYAGGPANLAKYDLVSTGRTGHAEAVEISYDPKIVSFGQLLRIYFSVAHDPTEIDRQGPDTGPQYRSAIFFRDEAQRAAAQAYITQLDQAHAFRKPIATKLEQLQAFYPAEAYHQDYLVRHPTSMYIVINDLPKVENLKRLFPAEYRAEPKLVASAS